MLGEVKDAAVSVKRLVDEDVRPAVVEFRTLVYTLTACAAAIHAVVKTLESGGELRLSLHGRKRE